MKALTLYAFSGLLSLVAASPLPSAEGSPASGVDQDALMEHEIYRRATDDQFSQVKVERSIAGDELHAHVKRDAPLAIAQVRRQSARRGRLVAATGGLRRGRATSFPYDEVTSQKPTACGFSGFDPMTAPFVALSARLMGPLAYNNPYCRLPVTLSYKGRTVRAYVGDKCTFCAPNRMVVSPAVMAQLNPGGGEKEPLFGLTWELGTEKVDPVAYTLDVDAVSPEDATTQNQNEQQNPDGTANTPNDPNAPDAVYGPTTDELLVNPGTPSPNASPQAPSTPNPNASPQAPGTPNPNASPQAPGTTNQEAISNPGAPATPGTPSSGTATTPQQRQQIEQQQRQQGQQSQGGLQPQVQPGGLPPLDLNVPINTDPSQPSTQFPAGGEFNILPDSNGQPSPSPNTQSTTPKPPTTGNQKQSSTTGNGKAIMYDGPVNNGNGIAST